MLSIKYEDIIKNMSDYIEEDFIRYRNGTAVTIHPVYKGGIEYGEEKHTKGKKRLFPSENAFFMVARFYNCYILRLPDDKSIKTYWFRVKSSIFRNGVRPSSFDLITFLHYPNQLMAS